jgi:hypothetical protein
MKLTNLKSLLWSLFLVALLVGLPYLCSEAQAQPGGGGRDSGVFIRCGPTSGGEQSDLLC